MKIFQDKETLARCHIYQMLKKSGKNRHISFHTPGHKIGRWDITELSFSDNLASPRGCIKKAEEDVATLLGAKRSFLLTDGSTSGVLSMLYAAKELGVKRILTSENVHESFFNGCALLGLTPLIYTENREKGVPLPRSPQELEGENPDLLSLSDCVFLTSPSYYGALAELAAWREYCDKTGKPLLIDGAHGGHLHFDKKQYAGAYADMWVDGVHKSLPALTQGAVVSAREGFASALLKGVRIFRTTSPSYPVLASVEYAVKLPQNLPLQREVISWVKQTPRLYLAGDWTKVCAYFGKNAFFAQSTLEKAGIYPEFCDGNILMFYLSPATKARNLRVLQKALSKLFIAYPYEEENSLQRNPAPLLFNQNAETEWLELERASGRICAANCGLFPPCTPLLLRGERIEEAQLDLLKKAPNVFGLLENKILVFK